MGYQFASKNLTMGEMNAIVKKLGGEENARKLLRDELIVSEPAGSLWIEKDGIIYFSVMDFEQEKEIQVAVLKGNSFDPTGTFRQVLEKAEQLEFGIPIFEIATKIRAKFTDNDIKRMSLEGIIVMHESFQDFEKENSFKKFGVFVNNSGLTECNYTGNFNEARISQVFGYAFVIPKKEENSRKLLRDELAVSELVSEPRIQINRSQPFDPVKFIGVGWSIEEQDERAITLTEIDLTCVMFDSTLEKGKKSIKGEDKLKRLKEKNVIRLDAKIFQTLWENQHLIPEKWKEQTNGGTTFIFFDGTVLRNLNDGTVLRNSNGGRCVLCLYWGDGRWGWYYGWLDDDFNAYDPSVVLAS